MGGFLTKSIDEDAEKVVRDEDGWRALQSEYRDIMVEKHGEERVNEILSFNRHNTIVYPNLFVNSRLAQIRILHTTAQNNTEQHGYIFRRGGAPEKRLSLVRALPEDVVQDALELDEEEDAAEEEGQPAGAE